MVQPNGCGCGSRGCVRAMPHIERGLSRRRLGSLPAFGSAGAAVGSESPNTSAN